jgi:hypothetical protein
MDELVERLRAQPRTVDQHLEAERETWLVDLQTLIQQIQVWLRSGVEGGVFRLEELEVDLDEQDVGTYRAPGLKITLIHQHRHVLLTPQGFRIQGIVAFGGKRAIGFRGRVDLSSGPTKIIFLRRKESEPKDSTQWDILMSTGNRSPLDKDTFADALAHVLGED